MPRSSPGWASRRRRLVCHDRLAASDRRFESRRSSSSNIKRGSMSRRTTTPLPPMTRRWSSSMRSSAWRQPANRSPEMRYAMRSRTPRCRPSRAPCRSTKTAISTTRHQRVPDQEGSASGALATDVVGAATTTSRRRRRSDRPSWTHDSIFCCSRPSTASAWARCMRCWRSALRWFTAFWS